MDIANKPGVYKDFSGKIKWRRTVCVVRNADFAILEKDVSINEIIFSDVVFVSGAVSRCFVKNGLNLACDFYNCIIDYMINKGGEICDCAWRDGIFEDGIFNNSAWFDGIWIKGIWDYGKNSFGKKMKSTPDKWRGK